MRLVVLAYGTDGDTRPVAALSRAVMDANHNVTLLADGGTLGNARDLGVPHAALAGDIRRALNQGSELSSVVKGKNSLNATTKALSSIANENASDWMSQVLDISAGADGLIVAGLTAYIGFSAAEKLNVPVIAAAMIPLTPTSEFPSPFLPSRSMPRWLNRFSYTVKSRNSEKSLPVSSLLHSGIIDHYRDRNRSASSLDIVHPSNSDLIVLIANAQTFQHGMGRSIIDTLPCARHQVLAVHGSP